MTEESIEHRRAEANDPDRPAGAPPAPPPPPPPPPPASSAAPPAKSSTGGWTFRRVTDIIGGPNLRLFDNLFSLGSVLVGVVVGLVVTYGLITVPDPDGTRGGGTYYGLLAVGGVIGLVAGGVLGGLVLMVLGWFRRD